MPRTPTGAVRVKLLRALSGNWKGDVIDYVPGSAAWLVDHGLAEYAPDLDLTVGGRAFTRPELLEPAPPAPPRARPSA
jgi:hypothetical protein